MIFASTNWRNRTGFGPSVTTSTVKSSTFATDFTPCA
jgi:hypothetical protein